MTNIIEFPKWPHHQHERIRKILRIFDALGQTVEEGLAKLAFVKPESLNNLDEFTLNAWVGLMEWQLALHTSEKLEKKRLERPDAVLKLREPEPKEGKLVAFPLPRGAKTRLKKLNAKAQKAVKTQAPPETQEQPSGLDKEKYLKLFRRVQIEKRDIQKENPMFTDTDYRDILQELFGVDTSKGLPYNQLLELLRHLQAIRNREATKKTTTETHPDTLYYDSTGLGRTQLMKKIEALLAEKGQAEGKHIPWAYAAGILKRQTGGVVKRFEYALPEQLRAVIAALNRDAIRNGRRTK